MARRRRKGRSQGERPSRNAPSRLLSACIPFATERWTMVAPWRVLGGSVVRTDKEIGKRYGDRVKDGEVSLMLRPAKGSRCVLGFQTPAGVLSGGDEGFIPLVAAEEPPPRHGRTRARSARLDAGLIDARPLFNRSPGRCTSKGTGRRCR
jgi:hypothetical protein